MTLLPVLAQTSRVGPTQISGGGQTHRFPAAAYDSKNDIYLITWGLTPVKGRFIDANGVPIGTHFTISQSGTDPGATGVAYSPEADVFLVVWLNENPGRVLGRLIRYSNGVPQFLNNAATGTPNEFQVAVTVRIHTGSPPNLAYSPVQQEFFVTWADESGGFPDVFGQKIDSTGALRGARVSVAATANWEGLPDVAYNSAQDEYFVVFHDETPAGAIAASGQRIGAGAGGTLLGSPTNLFNGRELYPHVAYDSFRNQYFVITWHAFGAINDVYGRLVSGVNGAGLGNAIPIASSGNFEGGDGIGIAYNQVADAYFGVSLFSAPGNDEIWGVEINGAGVPQAPIQVTQTGTRLGNGPLIAASTTQPRFLVVASLAFVNIGSQLLELPSVAPPPPSPPPGSPTLTIAPAPSGGTISSSPGSISCGADCNETYFDNTVVTLTPSPDAGRAFAGWGGAADCLDGVVTLLDNNDVTCTAYFTSIASTPLTPGTPLGGLDFNGDGSGDIFYYDEASGHWGQGLDRNLGTVSGTWSGGWTIAPGDFNNDGLTDLLLYNFVSGDWFKAIGNGLGNFTYFGGNWGPGWTVRLGSFNTDSLLDVFLYRTATGEWYRGTSDGNGTGNFSFITGSWSPGWSVHQLDLTFDDLTDLFLYNAFTGRWFRAHTTASGFDFIGGTWSPGWQIYAADFNADSVDDLFLYAAGGAWYVATTTGASFSYAPGFWSSGWQIDVGDFNADGRDDLFLYNDVGGGWYEAFSDGAGGFSFAGGGWPAGWEFHLSDFNTDGRADVFVYRPSTGEWVKGTNTGPGAFSVSSGTLNPDLTILAQPSK